MASWVYIFSKFTSEALLFEALVICFLCASYAAFWVLRKRKYGVLGSNAPEFAVKGYLSQLILDAEQMRTQLFGLLAGAGGGQGAQAWSHALRGNALGAATPIPGAHPPADLAALRASPGTAAALLADPELAAKVAALEAKMNEQARAMDGITAEKVRLEKELAHARAAGAAPASGGDSAEQGKMAEKINVLEAKLAEYSVIEDDLANLKRLQQENAQLKTQLAQGTPGGAKASPSPQPAAAPVEVSSPTEIAPEEIAQASAPDPVAQASALVEEAAAAASAAKATDAAIAEAAASGAEPPAVATADPGFEGLVDQVEKSLDPAAPGQAAPAGASTQDGNVTAAADGRKTGARAGAPEKSDADLVAEFEKMLNS